MDKIDVDANPEYLAVTANIDKKTNGDDEFDSVVNAYVDLKKDVENVKVKVSLEAEVGGVFREIYPSKDYNPCEDAIEDELVKYILDSIEKHGNLKIQCPFKQVSKYNQIPFFCYLYSYGINHESEF